MEEETPNPPINNSDDESMSENEEDIIAQAEAPMVQEGFEESGVGDTGSKRKRGSTEQNQMILGIGDNAYEIMDETGERVYIEFLEFLNCYRDTEDESTVPYYITHLQALSVPKSPYHSTLFINYQHLLSYHPDLAEAIEDQYVRFENFLKRAFYTFWKDYDSSIEEDASSKKKNIQVAFFNMTSTVSLRQLHMDQIGRLVSIGVTITRTSDVKPELQVASYQCDVCGFSPIQVLQQCSYTFPSKCRNSKCENTSAFTLESMSSDFMDWQKLKCQELARDVPPGNMPRSIDVLVRGEMVDRCRPGSSVSLTGCLVCVPVKTFGGGAVGDVAKLENRGMQQQQDGGGVSGLKGMGVKELIYRTVFVANSIVGTDGDDDGALKDGVDVKEFTEEEMDVIMGMRKGGQIYSKMVNSMCPQTFGHAEIKRGILLMLLSGVHKRTPEGMSLRGDINVCIVGDPSTAKSQFLKYVHSFLPNKCIYTSGKTSSAAGLTASVVRDVDTGDFNIEAGALMLADTGVCCIDEFDKMDIGDQVAIHEAMEQQTISITKAGISATLHARTSILAAANPIHGRYDKSKTLKANVSLSAPILSRFDLFFVVVDECDELIDFNVAKHILSTHRTGVTAVNTNAPFSLEQMRLYIQYAKTLHPRITPESQKVLIDCYSKLRQGDALGRSRTAYRITVRQIESMIRLSEALARLHLDEVVQTSYVQEAYRLLRKSIIRVETEDINLDDDLDNANLDEVTSAAPEDPEEEAQPPPQTETNTNETPNQPTKKRRATTKITLEQYEAISNAIAIHLRTVEEGQSQYLKWKEVVHWYLLQQEKTEGIEGTAEYAYFNKLVNLVLTRLIDVDHVLVFHGDDAKGEDGGEAKKEDRVLAVHPNFVIS